MKMRKWYEKRKKFRKESTPPEKDETLEDLLKQMKGSKDFLSYHNPQSPTPFHVSYLRSMVDTEILHRDILPYLNKIALESVDQIRAEVPIQDIQVTDSPTDIQQSLLTGAVMIQLHENDEKVALIRAEMKKNREVSIPEVEFSVVGPKEAFVESINTNLNLIRKRLPIPELQIKEFTLGKLSKTKVAVLYIEGIANEENVNTALQRVGDLKMDQVVDSSFVSQMIQDNHNSPFPQLLDTERPDRVAAVLAEGKVSILVDGAPHALIGPATLVEYFSAFEDYFLNWIIASAFRLIRLFAVMFSLLITPIYVAVLTYHYELIPKDLVGTLVTSRQEIPLPPILEAIFLELAIELLREAGARLPTKVGQTIGIVGGIVIGTASVEAGLTSNVLLIIVALAALASFTTPVYQMGNTIRLIRFPFIFMAHVWGLLGVALCFCFMLGHLLRLTSLGRPFMEPLFPPRVSDLRDAFIRLPFSYQNKRPVLLQTEDTMRFKPIKETKKMRDIDD